MQNQRYTFKVASVAGASMYTLHVDVQRPSVQVAKVVLHMALAKPRQLPEDMVQAASDAACSGLLQGDPRCGAGMNVLHYIALQPVLLLTRGQNTMRKLMELYLKTGPDVNGRDFWGQTPLHLLLHHVSAAYPVATAPPEVRVRLTAVLVLLLGQGADPGVRNGAGVAAEAAGDAGSLEALQAARAVVAGTAALEGCELDQVEAVSDAEAAEAGAGAGEGDVGGALQEEVAGGVGHMYGGRWS